MTPPFHGMDPFIEAIDEWEDFHAKLIAGLEESIAPQLPARYFVKIGERFYVIVARADDAIAKSDVSVSRKRTSKRTAPALVPSLAVADAPVTMRARIDEMFRETFLEIRALPDRALVTSIEVLSPTNKRPGTDGWKLYLRKRQGCLEDPHINFVEIDLLRGGQRMPMFDPWPDSPYYVLVNRQGEGTQCKVWPAHALKPLPVVPIPLERPDPDVPVDLQALVERIHARSRYDRQIDYAKGPQPALAPAEQDFLKKTLRARKR